MARWAVTLPRVSAVDTEVIVVGAGVMGLATARELQRSGRDVVVCEQFELGHARGSSHGAARIVRLSYPDARWVRLAQESLPLWRELEADCGRPLLSLHGTLDLGDWGPNRDALTACGAPFAVLDAGQIEHRFGIRADPGDHGLFQADRGIVRADAALAALAAGVEVRERLRVAPIDEDGDGVTAGGLRARVAVVTAGAWAPELAWRRRRRRPWRPSPLRPRRARPLGDRPRPADLLVRAPGRPGRDGLKAGLPWSGRPARPRRRAPSRP